MQIDFPSTVSTIFRTGEKISEKTSAVAYCLLCQVCNLINLFIFSSFHYIICSQGIMDINMSPSSAMEATKYSKYVSLMGVKALKLSFKEIKNEGTNEKNCNGCKCRNKQDLREEIIESLCYACTHIVQDLVRIDLLSLN